MKYEPLKGKTLLWNQITGDIETTDGKYFLETKTEDARFFRIFLKKDVKSAVQGLLKKVDGIKECVEADYENGWISKQLKEHTIETIEEIENLIKEWLADVAEGEE